MADEFVNETTMGGEPEAPGEAPGTDQGSSQDQSSPQDELEKARAQAAEYLDGWQRARAELANYRKRMERDQAELSKTANANLIYRLLPVLDDLQRAFQTVPPDLRDLTWIEGIALIERKLNAILEAEGLQPIQAVGQQFDPNLHEAVVSEETTQVPEGQVVAEFQKGYTLNGRVLRPAMVKVARSPGS